MTWMFVVLLGVIIYPWWIPRLDPVTNIMNMVLMSIDSMKTPMYLIRGDDYDAINEKRIGFSYLPMGWSVDMKKSVEVNVTSAVGHDIPVHVHVPHSCVANCPVLVYYHGGGFVVGSAKIFQPIVTKIANQSAFIVAAVDYRKAPEHKFPAAPLDCIEATEWIYRNIRSVTDLANPSKLAIAGDSAGGNLAAVVTNALSEKNIVKFSLLVYPVITHGGHMVEFSKSRLQYADAPILTANKMAWYTQMYFDSLEDLVPTPHLLACGLCYHEYQADPSPEAFPRVHILTAEVDPLRGEGELYRDHMLSLQRKAGAKNRITYKQYDNTVHGFFGIPFLPHGTEVIDDVSAMLRDYFA